MLGGVLRIAPVAAVLAGLVVAVPSAAQVTGSKIVFAGAGGIYAMNPDGSGLTGVRGSGQEPLPSPDGSRIAFFESNQLYVMNSDGSGAHFVANGFPRVSRQAWSPDGSRIAFKGIDPAQDIYVVSAAGGTPQRLTSDDLSKEPPVWSPTGTQLVYSSRLQNSSARTELFVIDVNGGAPVQITDTDPDSAGSKSPTWSPDGRAIAFIRFLGYQPSIYVVHPDGTELHRVVGIAVGSATDRLAWSPDGTKIAYSTTANSGYSRYGGRGSEVYAVAADGSTEQRLTELAPYLAVDMDPSWSPDGAQILFSRGSSYSFTMNADGTCDSQVGPRADFASWQPLTGGPAAGSKRCHAISVDGNVYASIRSWAANLSATVTNEGTEPLTNVTLVVTATNDVSLLGSPLCRVRRNRATCRLDRLDPGTKTVFYLQGETRRVGLDERSIDVALRTRFSVSATEQLLPTRRETDELRFAMARCVSRNRGGGRIDGTRFPDKICGRRGADQIHPGEGNDAVEAGDGNDVIFAKDGFPFRDQISCGRGRDSVVADPRDFVARDCERVRRR
jgi:Tol biopolymer transport system component